MYSKEQLEKYPFFREKLEETDLSGMLDQLTGLVSRGNILWFAQWLIDHDVPFSNSSMIPTGTTSGTRC